MSYISGIIFRLERWFKKDIYKPIRTKMRIALGINVIVDVLQRQSDEIYQQTNTINDLRKIIKERTEYHIDVHQRTNHNSQIILIGKFRNNDFVKCYDIPDEMFKDLIQHCRELEKYSSQGKIDAFPSMSATIKHTI